LYFLEYIPLTCSLQKLCNHFTFLVGMYKSHPPTKYQYFIYFFIYIYIFCWFDMWTWYPIPWTWINLITPAGNDFHFLLLIQWFYFIGSSENSVYDMFPGLVMVVHVCSSSKWKTEDKKIWRSRSAWDTQKDSDSHSYIHIHIHIQIQIHIHIHIYIYIYIYICCLSVFFFCVPFHSFQL
jgi:hypothetical protein